MRILKDCKPEKVFEFFELLCSVPHGSGNTKQISNLCVAFARERNLTVRQDEFNNVVIIKEAAPGYEHADSVILQGHLDMVCASTPDCGIDMAKDGLRLQTDGEWVSAVGTSLGGDDCIAVAIIMAILDDNSLGHPRLEAVFTTDEETGMDGAVGLDLSDLKGRCLVNLDSEEEGALTVSCAGGIHADCLLPAQKEPLPAGFLSRRLVIRGLKGGHSGVDIDKGRASAIMLMGRFLHHASLTLDMCLQTIGGGTFANVIPLRCEAVVALPAADAPRLDEMAGQYDLLFKDEYSTADPGVTLCCTPDDNEGACFSCRDTARMLTLLFQAPFGIEAMSMELPGLVQTSSNPGVVSVTQKGMELCYSVRSSLASQKAFLTERITALVKLLGGEVALSADYPGWAYRKDSLLRTRLAAACEQVLGKPPAITATHGGLECGLFIEKLPDLDCVSLGPELREIHSVRERLNIRSTENLYRIVTAFLRDWK